MKLNKKIVVLAVAASTSIAPLVGQVEPAIARQIISKKPKLRRSFPKLLKGQAAYVTLKCKSYIYKANGKLAKKKPLKKGKRLKVFGQKISKGKLYYKISKNSYVKGIDTVGLEITADDTLRQHESQPKPSKSTNRLEELKKQKNLEYDPEIKAYFDDDGTMYDEYGNVIGGSYYSGLEDSGL